MVYEEKATSIVTRIKIKDLFNKTYCTSTYAND
jgi:hypothetical protein